MKNLKSRKVKILLRYSWLSVLFCLATSESLAITTAQLFRNSYRVYESQRNTIGVYRDSTVFNGNEYHPGSTANVGIGLIGLCIADAMGWDGNAKDKAIQTVESMVVGAPSGAGYFYADRNSAGVTRHFFDLNDGSRAWNSEYSTVDMAIYMAGAFFAKKHFADGDLSYWVDRQYREVNWSSMIANPSQRTVYRELDALGNGIAGTETDVFNEYMLVAYFAYKAEDGGSGPATTLWSGSYQSTALLPKSNYWGYEVLTDSPGSFGSNFIPQFCYYMCHEFTGDANYVQYLSNAMSSDRLWFSQATGGAIYEWGSGAGESNIGGYRADKILDNPAQTVSPHIIGGFAVIDPAGSVSDLLNMHNAGKGIYQIWGHDILWRYSLNTPSWRANSVQGIDYSSMLFGLASLPQHLGNAFFWNSNDYDIPLYNN